MKNYVLNEVNGYKQGKMIIVKDCENAIEAIRKAGMTEYIKWYEKFKTFSNTPVYEVYEQGYACRVEYVCR